MQDGQLTQLRKMRDAENLDAAVNKRNEATGCHARLPVPERVVTSEEVANARESATGVRSELELINSEMLRAQGALEHVGGAVAREQLCDATEAFDLAERYEREIEAEYESWKLLLEQMKEADAAQASNLGQTLAPFIAGQFQELTQRTNETVQLTPQHGTERVLLGGPLRSPALISVGTREQLSTLYRLSLAEYLQTVIVLDDQLVQSDDSRMDWFRTLLAEKARSFQIVVVTCRPGDYLRASELVPAGQVAHAEWDGGLLRAVDLGRAVCTDVKAYGPTWASKWHDRQCEPRLPTRISQAANPPVPAISDPRRLVRENPAEFYRPRLLRSTRHPPRNRG